MCGLIKQERNEIFMFKKNVKNIFNLEYGDYIIIEKNKYCILSMMKFIEGSSYWIEYKLYDENSMQEKFLNVELNGEISLFEIIKDYPFNISMKINYNQDTYILKQKGNGKIDTYFGMTDVGLKEEVEYYDYKSQDNEKIISIEIWKGEKEFSIGKYIKKVKILSESKY